jgi:hypothetical protein
VSVATGKQLWDDITAKACFTMSITVEDLTKKTEIPLTLSDDKTMAQGQLTARYYTYL